MQDATYPGSQNTAISAVDDATHPKFDVQAYRDCEDAANTVSTDGTDADNDETNTRKALVLEFLEAIRLISTQKEEHSGTQLYLQCASSPFSITCVKIWQHGLTDSPFVAHTISQRIRTLKKIPVELIPLGNCPFFCPRLLITNSDLWPNNRFSLTVSFPPSDKPMQLTRFLLSKAPQ